MLVMVKLTRTWSRPFQSATPPASCMSGQKMAMEVGRLGSEEGDEMILSSRQSLPRHDDVLSFTDESLGMKSSQSHWRHTSIVAATLTRDSFEPPP